jgi:hypothetical protein
MFSLLRRGEFLTTLRTETPAFVVSFGIAALFFKFHSFSLECLAFLATWFVLGGVVSLIVGRSASQRVASSSIQ